MFVCFVIYSVFLGPGKSILDVDIARSFVRICRFLFLCLLLCCAFFSAGGFSQGERAGPYTPAAYGAYASMMQQQYAQAPGAAAAPYGAGYGMLF